MLLAKKTIKLCYFQFVESNCYRIEASVTILVSSIRFIYEFRIFSALPPTTGIRVRNDDGFAAVSLGLACVTDLQCRVADPYSKCIDGVCDCAMRTNLTTSCSARNRGCIPGTFQVKLLSILLCRKIETVTVHLSDL